MGIKMTDVSATPRPDHEFKEALEEVRKWLVADAASKDKEIMLRVLHYPVILDGLIELLTIRELIRKRREERK